MSGPQNIPFQVWEFSFNIVVRVCTHYFDDKFIEFVNSYSKIIWNLNGKNHETFRIFEIYNK